MARVVVTGACGFVGRAAEAALGGRGVTVVRAVRALGGVAGTAPGAETVVVGDIAGPVRWAPVLRGADAVVHLAARVHVIRDRGDEGELAYQRTNVDATLALARAAADAGVRRFVYVSSVKAVAEHSDAPLHEACDPAPADAYGRSKLAAERALHELARTTRLDVVIVRPPLVYGPGVGGNFARLPRLVRLATRLPLPLDAPNRRSLVYVDNLADALATAVLHPEPAAGTYFVRDGVDLSTADLMRRLGAAMGMRPRLIAAPAHALRAAARALGRGATVERLLGSLQVDDTALRRQFGWSPPFGVDAAIALTAASLVSR